MGCKFHGCSCGAEEDETIRKATRTKWELKRVQLEKLGKLHSIWECDWSRYIEVNKAIRSTNTTFPLIMHRIQTEMDLLSAIKEGSFFGFVNCDLW